MAIEQKLVNYKDCFEFIPDAIIVVDERNYIIDFNFFAKEIFPDMIEGMKVRAFFEDWNYGNSEIDINDRHYRMTITPVQEEKRNLGRIISLSDLTEIDAVIRENKRKQRELIELNHKLKEANSELMKYCERAEELSLLRERTKVAREMHDSIGHMLTVLHTINKICIIQSQKNPEENVELIEQGIEMCKKTREWLSNFESGGVEKNQRNKRVSEMFMNLVENVNPNALEINLKMIGEEDPSLYELHLAALRICQEAITNVLRHSNGNKMDIVMECGEKFLTIHIEDNGTAMGEIKKGFGLSAMQTSVEELDGEIVFFRTQTNGFGIDAKIPKKF